MSLIRTVTALTFVLASTGFVHAETESVPEQAPAPAPSAASVSLNISIDSTGDIDRKIVTYACADGSTLPVQYINASPNFLAVLPVDGENHIFVTTLSASGARYVSGPYEWWSKGEEATLRDLMLEEDAEPLATCTAAVNTP